jgi:hypothetical protein
MSSLSTGGGTNPAVEHPATDRAFRIGQKQNVQVSARVRLQPRGLLTVRREDLGDQDTMHALTFWGALLKKADERFPSSILTHEVPRLIPGNTTSTVPATSKRLRLSV